MDTAQTELHDRLGEALAEYELARERGRALDLDAFLKRYADLAGELAPLLDAVAPIDLLMRPVREALAGRPPLDVATPDGYQIVEELGRGGMGCVYKARQTGTEQLVALKLLRPDWLAGLDEPTRRQAVKQFRNEARLAARLRHPNRVRILHLGEHEGRPFYAMELVEGCSLAEKLKRPGGVSKEAVVKYLTSVAEAVQEAHDRGILHRDIKPGNILIDERTDEALLTDFGLAMIAAASAGPAEQSVREQARVAGTLPYMSPEQTQDADLVTVRSDVYSLGATLYEALAGSPPFTDTSRGKLLARIREAEPEPPGRHGQDVSPQLQRICLRCLRKDPAERFDSARDLAEALRGFTHDVRHLRNFTAHGTLAIVLGLVWLLVDVTVYWMLLGPFWEPLVWALVFSGYLKLTPAMVEVAWRARGQGGRVWQETHAIWLGHFVAAVSISVALRTSLSVPPRDVILLAYSAFAALSGMAYFIESSKMSWKLSWGPIGFWLVGVAMLFHRDAAPLYYGGYTALGAVVYGLHLRRLGKQLG